MESSTKAIASLSESEMTGVRVAAAAVAVLYAGVMWAGGALRTEHIVLNGLLAAIPWIGPRSAHFMRLAIPLWLTALLYESHRWLLPFRGEIHVADLYAAERALFPAPGGGTWPEFFGTHNHPVVDLLAGFAYSTYFAWAIAVGIILFVLREPGRFHQVVWNFLMLNVVGIGIYLLYPAAPPWYVMEHGLGPADPNALPSAAGCLRIDALLGIRYFESFYSRSPNVFGAMPSLHVAYPILAVWHTWDRGWKWRAPTLAYALLMGFSAVYLSHHYILDVLAGAAIAFTALIVVRWVFQRLEGRQRPLTASTGRT